MFARRSDESRKDVNSLSQRMLGKADLRLWQMKLLDSVLQFVVGHMFCIDNIFFKVYFIDEKIICGSKRSVKLDHLLENGFNNRTDQELLGHRDLQTTMIYIHVAEKNVLGVRSLRNRIVFWFLPSPFHETSERLPMR